MNLKIGDIVWACYFYTDTDFKLQSRKHWKYISILYSSKIKKIDDTIYLSDDNSSRFSYKSSICNYGDPVYD